MSKKSTVPKGGEKLAIYVKILIIVKGIKIIIIIIYTGNTDHLAM